MSAEAPAAAFDGRGLVELGPGATAEQRIDFLMTQVTALQKEVGRLGASLMAESRERHEGFITLGATVSEAAATAHQAVKDAKAEGLAQEAIGLWCVGAGVVLAVIGSLLG
jgi:hypothetical protein